jgi:hypothetical protein
MAHQLQFRSIRTYEKEKSGERILEKCVNPFCNRPFRDFSGGKLFLVEFPPRLIEHFAGSRRERCWLCEECSRIMTVAIRREFDAVSVRIINLSPNGKTKLDFVPAAAEYSQPDLMYSAS